MMTLTLYSHPLSSYCWKALIALYEKELAFEPALVNFADPDSCAAFEAVWPLRKMPVLRDEARGQTVGESSVVIEYLDIFHPGAVPLLPEDPDLRLRARFWDRFFDLYVQTPMNVPVQNALRPEGTQDAYGVEKAPGDLARAYGLLELEIGKGDAPGPWFLGEMFSMVDCAAAPALFYADLVAPLAETAPAASAYLDRLMARPSIARVMREAEPFFQWVPLEKKPSLTRG